MSILPKLQNFSEAIANVPVTHNGWISVYFNPVFPWPVRLQTLDYLDQTFLIIPHTNDALPAIAVELLTEEKLEYQKMILRIASVLSWKYEKGIEILGYQHSGYLTCYQAGNIFVRSLGEEFKTADLPKVTEEKCRLAMALLRDARSLKHNQFSFAFLQFWRVLEVTVGKDRVIDWISNNLNHIHRNQTKELIDVLLASGIGDIPRHLFNSGRCAIAHASGGKIINPDNPNDSIRLRRELPIMEELAALSIANKFGI